MFTVPRLAASVLRSLLIASVFFACAEPVEDIDRVQPFAFKKAHFVGEDLVSPGDDPEFWTQATLIDVGYGASQSGLFTSTYAQPMARIKWQITEDLLIGRASYERLKAAMARIGTSDSDGIIVCAFRISDTLTSSEVTTRQPESSPT